MLRARLTAKEAAAVGSVRTLSTAEAAYLNAYPSIGYTAKPSELGAGGVSPCVPTSSSACLIADSLANASADPGKGEYVFIAAGDKGEFLVPSGFEFLLLSEALAKAGMQAEAQAASARAQNLSSNWNGILALVNHLLQE